MIDPVSETTRPVFLPMESAPRDGTPFWGRVGTDAIRMLWHPGFGAFVSQWRRMTMAPGLKWVGEDGVAREEHDHSPTIHAPDGWLPLPEGIQ